MNVGVFVSDYTIDETLERIQSDKLGLILVANGVYHAALKQGGKTSSLLDRTSHLYVLAEDLQTRGIPDAEVDGRVKVVTYGDVVDLMFNDFDKLMWV